MFKTKYIPHFGVLSLKTRPLKFYLTNSFIVHFVILLLAITTGKIALSISDKLKTKNLELVQASVRVDMVAMPKHTLKELQQVSAGTEEARKEEAPPAEKIEEKKVDDEALKKMAEARAQEAEELALIEAKKKEESKKKNFQDMLKKISAKKIDSKGESKTEKGLYGKDVTDLKQLVLAGNKVSQGVSVYGDGQAESMTAFQLYISKFPEMIKPHWRLPSFLMNKGLQCRVRVWLKPSGELNRAEIYQSSGEAEYDQRAIDAVKRAAPFPKASEELGKRLEDGFLVGFPL